MLANIEAFPIKANQVLSADDLDDKVGFAWSGQYRVLIGGPNQTELTIALVQAGGHFGAIPAFAAIPRMSFAVAADHSGLLLLLAREIFVDLVMASRPLCSGVLRSMAQAAVLRADRLFEFATFDIRTRLLAELLRLSNRQPLENNVLKQAPTHEALAASVGSSRAIITRILIELRDDGLVDARYKTIRYLDYERLRRLVVEAVGPRPSYTFPLNDTAH